VEEAGPPARLVDMKTHFLLTALAFAVLALALGGWVVQSLRRPPALA
jgi:hypothetical protein